MSTLGFDFGQSERLTTRLRGIIRNYPRGIGILKELIQNADDAGASRLDVVMDWRRHNGTRLPDQRMQRLMGPALLFVNDQRFSEQDIEGICRIGEGSKLESARKTGRFGLGFNTVYNITDCPSFLTNDSIYCFDPHQNAVASANAYGMGWKLERLWTEAPDWPAVFRVGGLQSGATDFDGAIFRLPIREQGGQSAICTDAFASQDFEDLVALAQKSGSELLLFTKNILELTIREIDPTGRARHRLRIACTNADEVKLSRANLMQAIQDDLSVLLESWMRTSGQLPRASYRQRFAIVDEAERTETWQVESGLFRGDGNRVLQAAREMAEKGEKAIPWAGVAARIKEEPLSVQRCVGRLFCGLPLPIKVDLPIHVNAYFDLNSSRQQLTTKNEDGETSTAPRVRWNQVLLEQAVGHAWVRLLGHFAAGFTPGFYEIWPDPKVSVGLLEGAVTTVYQMTATMRLIRARSSTIEMVSAQSIALPPPSWREELHAPLTADGVPLPEPPLPAHIESGYEGVLGEITPQFVRDRLRIDHDLDTEFDGATRACLGKRSWVEAFLRFCLSDKKRDDLKGLPLALLCDGKLHTFGFNSAGLIFTATNEQRALFERQPHWFLDPAFAAATGVEPVSSMKLVHMTNAHVAVNLAKILGTSTSRPWAPSSPDLPNAAWLARLLDYLAKHEWSEPDLNKLRKLSFIPASDGQLHAPGAPAPPLLSHARAGEADLLEVLRAASIPLVEPMTEVEAPLQKLARAHPSLFTEICGQSVIAHLHALRKDLALSKSQAVVLLDFLSEKRWVYDDAVLKQLKELPVFPVASGLVRGTNPGLYRPAGFELPPLGLTVHLLENAERWEHLCERLGIQLLEQRRFLTEMVLPALPELSDADRWSTWAWIRRIFWGDLLQGEDEDLRAKLGSACVRATDGDLHAVRELHDPRSKVIQDVFGDAARYPDMSHRKDRDGWLNFFGSLGLIQSPSSEELLRHIDTLAGGGLAASAQLHKVWTYIFENWDELSERSVRQGRATRSFAQALGDKAWLPALSKSNKPGFRAPDARLYRASELHESVELVGSQAPVFAWQLKLSIASALGVQRSPSLSMVLSHFDCLLSLWVQEEPAQADVDAFDDVLGHVYDYIGRFAEKTGSALSPTDWVLLRRYRDRPCLWDRKRRRFWPPAFVFGESVPFFEPFRTHIEGGSARQRAAFGLLGSKEAPTDEDYVAFLRELAAASEWLSEPQRKQALTALKSLAGSNVPSDLPLLTRDGRLLAPKLLYWDDAPWLREQLQALSIADDAIPHELLEALNVRRLSACAREELVEGQLEPIEPVARDLCRNLSARLRSPEFHRGLYRLLRHYHGSSCEPPPSSIASLTLVPVATLVTEVLLEDGASLGRKPVRFFFAAERNTLLVRGNSTSRVVPYLARTILRQVGEDKLQDLSPLEHILSCEPREIGDVLDEDRIRDPQFKDVEISWASPASASSDEAHAPSDTTLLAGDEVEGVVEGGDDVAETAFGPAMTFKYLQDTPMASGGSTHGDEARDGDSGTMGRRPMAAFFSGTPARPRRPSDAVLDRLLGDVFRRDPNELWANVSHDSPPLEPGIGRSTVQRGGAGADWLGMDWEDGPDDEAAELREKALTHVLEFEASAGREATRTHGETSARYDILSRDPATGEERHIKVKATSHDWRERPVRMTKAQVDYALAHSAQSWLYVVERLVGVPRLHRIKDPAGNVRGFRFDATWASRAEGRPAPREPREGMHVYSMTNNALLGKIVSVKGGTFKRLKLQVSAGIEQTITFKPTEHRLEESDGSDAT
jgi:sacsin